MNSISNIIIYFIAIFFSLFITAFITSNFGFVDSFKKLLFEPKGIKNLTIFSIIILTLGLFASYSSTIEQVEIIAKPKIETSKSITFSQASQMISDDGYRVLDEKIIDGNQFMFLTDDGLYCQIMFINGTLPKEEAKLVIFEKGNPIQMKNKWDREVY